jgi:hypothetical protein
MMQFAADTESQLTTNKQKHALCAKHRKKFAAVDYHPQAPFPVKKSNRLAEAAPAASTARCTAAAPPPAASNTRD